MNPIAMIAQRFLPLAAVVLVTVTAHRFVPPGIGILPRIFIITGIVACALWVVSKGIRSWNDRQAAAERQRRR